MSTTLLPFLRIIENLVSDGPSPTLPITLPHLLLNLPRQVPEIPIVFAPDVMRQFMTQGVPDNLIISVSIICVGS